MAKELDPAGLFVGSERALRVMGDRHKDLRTVEGAIGVTNPGRMGIVMIGPARDTDPFPEQLFVTANYMNGDCYGLFCDAVKVIRNKGGSKASFRVIPYAIVKSGDRQLFMPKTNLLLYGDVQAIEFVMSDLSSDADLETEVENILNEIGE